MKLRRLLFWCEVATATGLACLGTTAIATGILTGDQDYHGGVYLILYGILLLVGALAFGLGAWGLHSMHRSSWLAQLLPAGVVAWVLWDVLSHPANRPW